jgi:hypothetical protein
LVLLEVLVTIASLVVANALHGDDFLSLGEEGGGGKRVGEEKEDEGADDESESSHHDIELGRDEWVSSALHGECEAARRWMRQAGREVGRKGREERREQGGKRGKGREDGDGRAGGEGSAVAYNAPVCNGRAGVKGDTVAVRARSA